MNEQQVRNIIRQEIASAQKDALYSVRNVSAETHNGIDSPRISYNNLLDLPGTTAAIPSGSILSFGGATAPTGYLLCDGTAVSRTTYSSLFTAIGTSFGTGDGSTTFNVPDLRANVPAGYKSGDTNFGTLGGAVGEATHILTTTEIPSHNHGIPYGNAGSFDTGLGWVGDPVHNGYLYTNSQSTGGGGAHNNIQPSLTVNFIIKT